MSKKNRLFLSFAIAFSLLGMKAYATSPLTVYPSASVYLGGAYNIYHCQQVASASGYRTALFGAGYDWRGAYYPYWNACFGARSSNVPVPPRPEPTQYGWFSVWIGGSYSMQECNAILRSEIAGINCQEDTRWGKLECFTGRTRESLIESVRCVRDVNGPFEKPDL